MTCRAHPDHVKAGLFRMSLQNQPAPWFTFRARGGSMYPTLRDGDRLVVTRSAPERIFPGEIVVFAHGSQIVCHRLIRKERHDDAWWFYTQGDLLLSPDPGFNSDQCLGVVTMIHRADRATADLQTPSARGRNRRALRLSRLKPSRSDGRPLTSMICDCLERTGPGHALLRFLVAVIGLAIRPNFQPAPAPSRHT